MIPALVPPTGLRAERVRLALRRANSGWFYGLYRTPALVVALDAVNAYNHPWGHDFVTLLPFLLSGNVACSDAAVFYQRVNPRSGAFFRPRSAVEEYGRNMLLRSAVNLALRRARLSWAERAYLAPFAHVYVGRHSFKLRDIAQRRVRELTHSM